MGLLLQDVKYGIRILVKARAFALVAVLTLALGIGANTAVFSLVYGVLLHSLPFHDAGQLVRIEMHLRSTGLRDVGLSVPELQDLRSRSDILDQVSATWPVDAALTGTEHASRVELLGVSSNYFTLLGAAPAIGRVFGPEDDKPGFSEAVVISDGLWHRAYGADPHVLGRSLRLDNDAYTIVGVMPPDFRHPGPTVEDQIDLWATAGFTGAPFPTPTRSVRMLPGAIARLHPGVSVQAAQSRLDALSASLHREYANDYPEQAGWSIQAVPLQESLVSDARPLLMTLMASAGLILLIACVNIANLLLVRATGRQRELAIRAAVGATRTRLVRQMLTESTLLSLVSGVFGIAAAAASVRVLVRAIPTKIPRLNEVGVNRDVLLFGLLVAALSGVIFGILPALRSSRGDLANAMGGRAVGGSGRQGRLRSAFVVVELAMCLVLLVGSGLLLRTFLRLLNVDPGFRPNNVHVANVWIPVPNDPKTDRYATTGQRTPMVREMIRRARTLPGIDAAAMTTLVPLSGRSTRLQVYLPDRARDIDSPLAAEWIAITPEYFRVLGATFLRGREFNEADAEGKQDVVIVDESTAQRFWPNEDAIGKRIVRRFNGGSRTYVVVGVAGDIRHDGLDVDGVPHLYVSMYQQSSRVLALVMRAHRAPPAERQVRAELESIDPDLPIFGITGMKQIFDASLAQRRFAATMVLVFAIIAVLLAAVGLYGVVGYAVSQRTHEMGVRMALGAQPRDVVLLVLRDASKLIAIGVAVGLASAVPFGRMLTAMLYGVGNNDVTVFLGAAVLLAGVALLAGLIPATRAARIDPMIALRHS